MPLDTLFLRWPSHEDPSRVCVYDPATSTVRQDNIVTLKPFLQGKRVVAYLPATKMQLNTLFVPGKSQKQRLALLPSLLEEKCAQDIDELYFVLGEPLNGTEIYPTAYLAKNDFSCFYQALNETDAYFDNLIPELLVCPYVPEHWTLVVTSTYSWFRYGLTQGFAIETVYLPVYLQSACHAIEQKPVQCTIFHDATLAPDILALFDEKNIAVSVQSLDEDILALWQKETDSAFTLPFFQGEFRAKRPHNPHRRWLTTSGVLLGLGVVAWWIQQWLLMGQLEQQKVQLDTQVTALYQQAFPEQTNVVSPRATLTQALQKYPPISNHPSIWRWLRLLATTPLPQDVHIEQLAFTQDKIILVLSGQVATLETYQQALRAENIQITPLDVDEPEDKRLHLQLTLL